MSRVTFTSTDGRRTATWADDDPVFRGDLALCRGAEIAGQLYSEPYLPGAGMFTIYLGTVEWAGRLIGEVVDAIGLGGTFTWDPPPVPRPVSPRVTY